MNLVKTPAPISIEDLKKYFTDKSTFYIINYKESKLKGAKLLTYFSNLDIPCDIDFTGCDDVECYEMLKEYFNASSIVNIPILENLAIYVLKQYKELIPVKDEAFIQENKDIISAWSSRLDSLTIYNMSIVNDPTFSEFVDNFEKDDSDTLVGVNFISLLKHPQFYNFYGNIKNEDLRYYTHYFNDYMFKGKNMYSYWANDNNPMFLLTYGISEGLIKSEDYNKAKEQTLKELVNVTSV